MWAVGHNHVFFNVGPGEPKWKRFRFGLLLGLHIGGSDRFNTKTNNQTECGGFLINRSDPTDEKDLNRTEPN